MESFFLELRYPMGRWCIFWWFFGISFFGIYIRMGCTFCAASRWSDAVLAVVADTTQWLINTARRMSDPCLLISLRGDGLCLSYLISTPSLGFRDGVLGVFVQATQQAFHQETCQTLDSSVDNFCTCTCACREVVIIHTHEKISICACEHIHHTLCPT